MHLKDLLHEEIADFQQERIRLQTIFENTIFRETAYPYRKFTLKQYLSGAFLSTKIRGTNTDINDFLRSTSRSWNAPDMESLLFYCEVIANILYLCSKFIYPWDSSAKQLKEQCLQNIDIILDKTGYKFATDDDGIIAVIKKDALAFSVIEDINDKVAAKAILEYNRLDMKGNLEGKRKLLKQIGDFIEPTLQKRNELLGQLHELADDISFCLNNLNIRHNNKEGNHKKDFLDTMSDKDLEVLYDDAYRTALLLIELSKQEESHKRIGTVRQQSKGTK